MRSNDGEGFYILPVRDAAAAVVFFLVVVHAALGLLDEGFELDAAGAAGSAATATE